MSVTIAEMAACAYLHAEQRVPEVGLHKPHGPEAICPWILACWLVAYRPGKASHAKAEDYTDCCGSLATCLTNMCYKTSQGNPDVR